MKRALPILLAALLLLSSLMPAGADQTDAHNIVRLGYYDLENYMIGPSEDAIKSGYSYDLLSEVAAYNGWEYEYVYGAFGDLYRALAAGEIDMLPNVIRTDARAQEVLFADICLAEEFYFISALTKSADAWNFDVHQMDGRRVATVTDAYQNVVYQEWADANGIQTEFVYSDTFEGSWDLVRSGQAEYILNIDNTAPDSGFSTLVEVGKRGAYLAVSKSRPDLMADVNSALSQIQKISPFLMSHLQEKYLSGTLSSYKLEKDELEWLEAHPVLRVGGLINDVPYSYTDEEGTVVGVYPELLDMIISRLGLNIRIEWTLMDSLQTLRQALMEERIDLICPEYYSYYDADQNGIHISESIIDTTMQLVYSTRYSAVSNTVIAITNSRPGYEYIKDVLPEAEIRVCESFDECLQLVLDHEVACAVAHSYKITDVLREYPDLLTTATLNAKCTVCFAARHSDHALIRIINRGRHLVRDNEINALEILHATEQKMEYTIRQFFVDNMLLFILGGIAFVLLIALIVIIIGYYQKARRDIVEITRQKEIIEAHEVSLAAAEEAANAASRAKSAFLFNMSHDIRTPMNAIIGFNSSARKNMDDPVKLADCLDKVERSSRHLLSLINDVLDMARIESGKVAINEAVMTIEPLYDDIITLLSESNADKGLHFTSEKTVKHGYVMADRLNLNRVLMNIVSNAVKYTPAGGHVDCAIREVDCDREGCAAFEFITRDDGIGMSEEFVKTIFEAFTREMTSTASGIQGTGLGMAITRQLVDRMGGDIDVRSAPGKGSVFTVRLTFRIADDAAVREYEEAQTPLARHSVSFKGRRLLLVEDNELNREIAHDLLEENEFIVDDAEDGDIAVEKMRTAPAGYYDAVLMDIQMPRMNGYDAARAIRALPDAAKAGIPIIAMTANAFEEDKQNALAAGMNDHIAKPVDIGKLMKSLSALMK